MKSIILLIFISLTVHAGSNGSSLAKKKAAVVSAIINQESTEIYLKNLAAVKEHEKIIVSAQDFKNALSLQSPYQKAFRMNSKPELISKLQRFVDSNSLSIGMNSITYLQLAENSLLNIIFLAEIQKSISRRSDLQVFGNETIENLNTAITERIEGLYMLSEQYFKSVRFDTATATKMKRNFVNIGLDSEHYLLPSEQWLNEFLGLNKVQVKNEDPKNVLRTLFEISAKKIHKAFRSGSGGLCAHLFL